MQNDRRDLRSAYPEFVYDSFRIDKLPDGFHATYVYQLGEHRFTPSVFIPIADITNEWLDNDFIDWLFFNFGLINAVNYYKLAIPEKFVINAGRIDDEQKRFFQKLFYRGLGEFLYVNEIKIPQERFVQFVCAEPEKAPAFRLADNFHGNLIPVGGGKDSVVTLEALRSMRPDNFCFQYNRDLYPRNHAAIDCISLAGYPLSASLDFNLTIDKHLLELNRQGFYNGHVPFSSCLAFSAYIMAYLNNRQYIVLSNEASANEGNLFAGNHADATVNHQYSKSFEFEQDFRQYTNRYFSDRIQYFSLLRCLNEFQIVQKFLKSPRYLQVFRSCNVGMHENKWCGECAKCLYTYIMLYPFISTAQIQQIFGYDLFENLNLVRIFDGLWNPRADKPFECVGTKEEINYCLKLALERHDYSHELPYLLRYYRSYGYHPQADYQVENFFNPEHNIPKNYLNLLLKP